MNQPALLAERVFAMRNVAILTLLTLLVGACSESTDSCDDLIGTVTHSVVEITGIASASVYKRNASENTLQAVDPFTGTEYSNISIDLQVSWSEEQYRFRAPSTLIQSALDWFIPSANACSLLPYYTAYQPAVTSIQIYSDADFNEDYLAGTDLSPLFNTSRINSANVSSLFEARGNTDILSSRSHTLIAARTEGILAAIPATPTIHTLTIMMSLDDGRVYEFRTTSFLLSGV